LANYYLLFSFMIPGPVTGEEREWLTAALKEPEEAFRSLDSPDDPRPWVDDMGYFGFSYQFEADPAEGLWIYSEESGTPGLAAELLADFLTRFRPDQSLGFTWAETCSKPRLDAYGGGAVAVHGDGRPTEWMNAVGWLDERLSATAAAKDLPRFRAYLACNVSHE